MNTYIRSLHRLKCCLAILVALALTACAATPQQRVYQGYGIVTVSTKLVTSGVVNNQIKVKDAENFSSIAKIALSSLDSAQLAIQSNDNLKANSLLDQIDKILLDLQSLLNQKGIK